MNKKYFNLLISFIIFCFLYEIFDHSDIVIKTIYESTKIWFYNLVPTIFPIYIIIDLLLNYNGLNYLSKIFAYVMKKVFKCKKETSFVFLLSLISGFPSNSKYLKNLLDKKTINNQEALKLLFFTHFSNPLFIIESIGISFLQNKKIGIIILIIHYLTNILIGIFTRNYYVDLKTNNIKDENKSLSFIACLTNSIFNTVKILFLLFGIITFFMLITSIIRENIKINPLFNSLLCSLLEMTGGLKSLAELNISINLKATLMTFLISFGGFSIHMQVFSILSDYKIKYLPYLITRIMHGLISASLVYLILNFRL